MGMFDTVNIKCPACKSINTFQTKYGPCKLKSYTISNAPISVLHDMKEMSDSGSLVCEDCNAVLELSIMVRTTMRVKVGIDHDTWRNI